MNQIIKKWRKRLNISQSELALRVGVCQSTISRLEKKCNSSSYETVIKILVHLQVSQLERKNPIKTFLHNGLIKFLILINAHENLKKYIIDDPLNAANYMIYLFNNSNLN